MKKNFLVIFFCFGSILMTTAQSKFQLGAKIGYTSSSFTTDNASEIVAGNQQYTFSKAVDEFKGGYLIGAYSRIGLLGNLSLQPELYYAKKSGATDFRINDGVNDVIVSQNITTYSWDLPILLHVKVLDIKVANIYGLVGPVASFKGSDKLSYSTLSDDLNEENIKSTNWNFQLGGGVGVWKLNFDVRYEWGLNDVSKTKLERKSNALLLSLGYRFIGF
jgi:hypothetical protein